MSRETISALNKNTLIGFTSKRGNAWHYRADEQGDEPNHYPGAIPVEDVRRRLFFWTPVEAEVTATYLTEDGVTTVTDPTRKAIVRPDTGTVLSVPKKGYAVHPYREWLLDDVATIVDGDLAIGSAGVLRGGAVAWVQVEVEETMSVAGVDYRPFITGSTSLDGSMLTSYGTGSQAVICDNTLAIARRTYATEFRVRHTARSLTRITDVRQALGLLHGEADAFAAAVRDLTSEKVGEARWTAFLDAYTDPGKAASDRQKSNAEKMREELRAMWRTDERVAPWSGTAFGVLQAANTYLHHSTIVRGAPRSERNAERMLDGSTAKADARILDVLAGV